MQKKTQFSFFRAVMCIIHGTSHTLYIIPYIHTHTHSLVYGSTHARHYERVYMIQSGRRKTGLRCTICESSAVISLSLSFYVKLGLRALIFLFVYCMQHTIELWVVFTLLQKILWFYSRQTDKHSWSYFFSFFFLLIDCSFNFIVYDVVVVVVSFSCCRHCCSHCCCKSKYAHVDSLNEDDMK